MILVILCHCAPTVLPDTLAVHGSHRLAVIEYQRCFFLDPQIYQDPAVRLRYARAMLATDDIRGMRELIRIEEDFPAWDSATALLKMKYYARNGDHARALDLLDAGSPPSLRAYLLAQNGQYQRALQVFAAVADTGGERIVKSYLDAPRKSPRLALVMSALCPGAGEAYAGSLRMALTDGALTWGSIYLVCSAIRTKRYLDAGLVLSFLFNRFYFGSMNNARELAASYNQRHRERLEEDLRLRVDPAWLDY